MLKCALCGKIEEQFLHLLDMPNEPLGTIMREEGVCFHCAIWTEKVAVKDDPLVVRVNGQHYWIEENDTGFKGFGGHDFTIKFHDGREVKSSNLWCQGVIPEHFREALPNNATFVR